MGAFETGGVNRFGRVPSVFAAMLPQNREIARPRNEVERLRRPVLLGQSNTYPESPM